MSLEQEIYEERRLKGRRSAFWRGVIATIVVLVIAIYLLITFAGDRPAGPHIARVYIDGVIFDDPARDMFLEEIRDNPDVKAVILRINSPGGTTVGSEALFDSIRRIADQKPVVAVLSEVAASGGYITAIAADHVIARGNTVTGSIGVIMEYPDFTGLMEQIGVEMQTIRSSDIKGGPSPFRPLTEEQRAEELVMIEDANEWFKSLVVERRELSVAELSKVATGGVFSGRQALEIGLVDALGSEHDAREYLESLSPRNGELPIETWEMATPEPSFFDYIGAKIGINPLFNGFSDDRGPALYSLKR